MSRHMVCIHKQTKFFLSYEPTNNTCLCMCFLQIFAIILKFTNIACSQERVPYEQAFQSNNPFHDVPFPQQNESIYFRIFLTPWVDSVILSTCHLPIIHLGLRPRGLKMGLLHRDQIKRHQLAIKQATTCGKSCIAGTGIIK